MESLHNNPLYTVNDKPPITDLLLMGLQHLIKFGFLIILPIWLLEAANASFSELSNFISITLIGGAVTTILMTFRRPLGGNCFIPSIASVSYFACLYPIAQQGQVSQILGAAIIISITQMLSSFLIQLFKRFLTINLAGLGLFALGVWAAVIGVSELFHPTALGEVIVHGTSEQTPIQPVATLLGIGILLIMLLCLFNKKLSTISILIGMAIGWVTGSLLGFLPSANQHLAQQAAWFHWPHFFHAITFQFSWLEVLTFILVGIYAAFISFTLMTVIAHENDINWKKHFHQRSIKANLAAGLGALISTLLGGSPSSPIEGSVGDMITTRAYSRSIAYVFATLLVILAFIPKLFFFLITIPAAANGAAIILMGGMMCAKGLSLISFENLTSEELKAFPYAILFLVITEVSPSFYKIPFLQNFTTRNLIVGLLAFIGLSLFFSIRKLYGKQERT